MKSAVETLNPTRVKLTVEVPYEELAPSVDAAYKTISQQVAIPGFRKGKVPPRIIDQRVGRGAVLQEAVDKALPDFYAKAVQEVDVRPLGRPTVEVTDVPEGTDGDLKFTVEVDVRPQITLPDLDALTVTVDDAEVTEADVDERVESLRERFGTLMAVDRPVADGDFITLDIAIAVDGEEVEAAKSLSYQVGTGRLVEGLDDVLPGLSAEETTSFDTVLPGGELAGKTAHVTITVQGVKERELPVVDDDFAQLASEFDTLDELREDLRGQAAQAKVFDQGIQARERLVEQLLESLDIPVPDAVIADEVHHHLEGEGRLEDDEHRAEVDAEARKALQAQLLLDAIAEQEDVNVGQRELIEYLVQASQQYGMDPNQFMQAVGEAGQVPAMVAEVARRKALAVILQKATVTDASGNVVDLAALFEADEDEDAEGEELEALEPIGDDEPAPAGAADPSAVSLSDIGGFVPDEPVAK
ncbi:MAG: trigger factor [Kineosporiaceae bacterium]|nr:trigger factor [Kineosporiaceae bacterium]MBK7621646.1 trigger factor [Kineosporiaceae bacterium]MBK8077184.1 trigger factor [Kineosporiaceae bacterium]